MKSVPDLIPCPDCAILLESGDGPHDLAWHGCTPGRKTDESSLDPPHGRELLEDLANKKSLTPEEAATGLMRGLLLQMVEDPTRVPARAIGDVVAGAARLAESGGNSSTDDTLKQWLAGEMDE